jgi:peroxiredoxin
LSIEFTHRKEKIMTINVGDRLPEAALSEFIETATEGCALGPNTFKVSDLVKGKKIALFALPGAFTPTCSAQHVPGYIAHAQQLKAKGIDEIWCVSVNDAFVMGAWGREQKATGVVRMLGDGSAAFTKAVGLVLDLTEKGMGVRSQRYSMLLEDGVVTKLNVEAAGKFDVSNAETLLAQLG